MHETEQRVRSARETTTAPVAPRAGERYERYACGSPEFERRLFDRLARELMMVQLKTKKRSGARTVDRAFYAKGLLGVEDARLRFLPDLPEDLRVGFARPGAEYPVIARFSNASGLRQADSEPDLRGVALRIQVGREEAHDLIMTNHPVSHAGNAIEFVAFAQATAGADTAPRKAFAMFVKLPRKVGWATASRMRRNVRAGAGREVRSLATETFWSQGAMLWGEAGPVRFLLRPAPDAFQAPPPSKSDPDHLSHEMASRLSRGDVVFELCVQRYRDPRRTPVENAAVAWREKDSPAIPVATLTVPRQNVDTATARAAARRVDGLAFDPWNTTDDFRPLGNINRARKAAYEAGSAHRRGHRFVTPVPRRNVIAVKVLDRGFGVLNRFVPWHRLPTGLGLLNLIADRERMRRRNLIDTEVREAPPKPRPVPPLIDEELLTRRSFDGTYNDLSEPVMGSLGTAFGRNMPPVRRPSLANIPNPVTVSRQLLHRREFIPARTLNLLAASWIQFQVHDWVNHKRYPAGTRSVEVPLPPGMTWANVPGGPPERVMRFAENHGVPVAPGEPPILFANTASHWWDGSEVYGGDEAVARSLRDPDGGAELDLEEGHLPTGPDGVPITGFRDNWWLGLSLMHTLFAREHNTVCGVLRAEYPRMDEERIYHTARLVVSALIAKIHTVEWTPAILATEAIDIGLHANWDGPPSNWLTQLGLWLADRHALTGIPGTLPDHHGVPYSLTEEFVTVYRMHPLIPDDYEFADHRSGRPLGSLGFDDLQGSASETVLRQTGFANALYSFGIAHPGAITLHNYPRSLQRLERDGEVIDLSVVDLVRTRSRGVPRYNDFLSGLGKPRIRRFEDLGAGPETTARLRDVYRKVDDIDTMVGLFAENPPQGFGFSDTAFRIFLLMATRRLQSDRFLTVDFRPEIYTPLGLDWIAHNGMKDVLMRHCPELASFLPREASAFAPWRPTLPEEPPIGGPKFS
ncbi:peroxidase family protein [Actinocorallia aurantiaca]|uniref:Catalase n=1 Tax=Actinocorallia aurantiaca TaxID=46204 RepID=A0ABN3U6K0_9ACTN